MPMDFVPAIASLFPVCSASDEFHYFPQFVPPRRDWRVWDDFSEDSILELSDRLTEWDRGLGAVPAEVDDASIDARIARHTLRTLREHLTLFRPQKSQPTFHLSVASIGLSEALESPEPEAWDCRIAGLPDFLERAASVIGPVPGLFRAAGARMAGSLREWLRSLEEAGYEVGKVPAALGRFEESLRKVALKEGFALSAEELDLLVRDHLGCAGGVDGVEEILSGEIAEMEEVLEGEAARLAPGRGWKRASGMVPTAGIPGGGAVELFREEARRLEEHCRKAGLLPACAGSRGTLSVRSSPSYLGAVRASDSYAAAPGHPSRGGTFFVFDRGGDDRSLEFRMTTAHETWPGHHLLDVCRWNHPRPLRRSVERPLYYEGWACLGEEIMARTGYFNGPWDRFLLARRRLRRAARGRVDLAVQAGRCGLEEAAAQLENVGFPRAAAEAAVRKYALRPGYQVCYTIGLRRFLSMMNQRGAEDIPFFMHAVLSLGEIGFEDLEERMRKGSEG